MNKTIQVKIRKINNSPKKEAQIPFYATPGSAGADLYASLDEEIKVKPGERVQVPTGFALELPSPDLAALIFARSGLAAKKGLAMSNGVGVIDSDYRGEIKVLMINLGQEEAVIQDGDRIAQMLIINVQRALFSVVENLGDTLRGEGGFGSTGQK